MLLEVGLISKPAVILSGDWGCRKANDSGVFIEFTLSALFDIIVALEKHQVKPEDKHQVELSDNNF